MRSKRLRNVLTTVAAGGVCAAMVWSCYTPTEFELPSGGDVSTKVYFVESSRVAEFVGEKNVKVAFVRSDGTTRRVYYADFSSSNAVPKALKKPADKADADPDSPLISPDGNFVTYFFRQGTDGSGVYVQALSTSAEPMVVDINGAEGHWWSDPSTGQLYIVYSRLFQVSKGALSGLEGQKSTYRKPVTISGLDIEELGEEEAIAPYPMNGGLSRDGRWLCTGYYDAAFYDRSTERLSVINEGRQVCNPSISPSGATPDRMMFLNIGGKQTMKGEYVNDPSYPKGLDAQTPGDSIKQHHVVFIVDATDTVRDFYAVDRDKYFQWQDPEWSNLPNFATVLGDLPNSSDADGLLLNLTTEETLNLTPHDDYKLDATSTPSMWAATKPLNLSYPNGDETFTVGDTVTVRWEANSQDVRLVVVQLYKSAGRDAPMDLTPAAIPVSEATQYEWVVDAAHVSDSCIVRVMDNLDNSLVDFSEVFTVSN